MWKWHACIAILWLWATFDYLSIVHVSFNNHTTEFDAGIMYDTSSGKRSTVVCTGPCKTHCEAAKWTSGAALGAICVLVAALYKKSYRACRVLQTVVFLSMVATAALETHLSKHECTPRNLPTTATMATSLHRGRVPLLAATVLIGIGTLVHPLGLIFKIDYQR